MAATLVGVVYSVAQKKRRILIVPDDDTQLQDKAWVSNGTAMITLPIAQYQKMGTPPNDVDTWLASQIGAASSDRCAVIDFTGAVASFVKADPAIDSLPFMILVQHDEACVGDTYNNGVFTRRYAIAGANGVITKIVSAPITSPPAASAVGGKVMGSLNLNVGDHIDSLTASANPIAP